MTSTKPYLIRAIHAWCVDEGFTPYLAVAVDASTRVPKEFVRDGVIVLNVGLEATHQLQLGNDDVSFQARFGGKAFPVLVPVRRVQAIYARENGQGMAFDLAEEAAAESTAMSSSDAKPTESDKVIPAKPAAQNPPHLTRIK